MEVKIQFYGEEVIGLTLPTTVILRVAETQPSIKGATVTGSGKPATMETGLVVNVPDFVEADELLEINTAEGTYLKRANKYKNRRLAFCFWSIILYIRKPLV